jgi:hypothetical protein
MKKTVALLLASFLILACLACLREGVKRNPADSVGISVESIQLLAGGDLARLNYRVTDYPLARKSLGLGNSIRILPAGTSRPLSVTQAGILGPLRQRPSRGGRLHFVLFNNSGRILRPGDRADVLLGKVRVAGVPVS